MGESKRGEGHHYLSICSHDEMFNLKISMVRLVMFWYGSFGLVCYAGVFSELWLYLTSFCD